MNIFNGLADFLSKSCLTSSSWVTHSILFFHSYSTFIYLRQIFIGNEKCLLISKLTLNNFFCIQLDSLCRVDVFFQDTVRQSCQTETYVQMFTPYFIHLFEWMENLAIQCQAFFGLSGVFKFNWNKNVRFRFQRK